MCPKKSNKFSEKNRENAFKDIASQDNDDWIEASHVELCEENHKPKESFIRRATLTIKFTLSYIVLGIVLCVLLTSNHSHIIAIEKSWILFFLSIPCLYFLFLKFTSTLQKRNQHLTQKENELSRLIQAHTISSRVNHSILRQRNAEQLLMECCQIAQEKGQFAFVWAGLCQADETLPDILAKAGDDNNYLEKLIDGYVCSSAAERQEPSLAALRKKQPIVINDIEGFSKHQLSWQKRALENGYHAIAAFALKTQAKKTGLIAFYANQKDAFLQEELKVYRQLAADISSGLSEIEQKDQQFYLATYDVNTNLPNRALFEDRLKQSIFLSRYDNRKIAVAVVSILDFDHIIEQKGQEAADKMLQSAVNHLLNQNLDDDSLGMLGNNEIGIMLVDVNNEHDLPMMIYQIFENANINANQKSQAFTLQAGVAMFLHDADNGLQLIKLAKEAMYHQQSSQETKCNFHSKEIAIDVKNNIQIEQQLEKGLEQNEFVLYFQPIIDLQTRILVGVEVLTRWPNQKLGEVSPIQFFAVAERSDLMMPLGNWIIKSACQQLLTWKKMGFGELFLAINISPKQMLYPEFIDSLNTIFKEIQFNPKKLQLCFEISEKVLSKDLKQITEILTILREMGIKIFIDDYGTGPTSLVLLNQIPTDTLKIDAKFIRAVGKDQNAEALVRGVVSLANGLDLQAIAEGVETENQLQLLQELGCKLAQGYFFSPPVVAKNITPMLGKTL